MSLFLIYCFTINFNYNRLFMQTNSIVWPQLFAGWHKIITASWSHFKKRPTLKSVVAMICRSLICRMWESPCYLFLICVISQVNSCVFLSSVVIFMLSWPCLQSLACGLNLSCYFYLSVGRFCQIATTVQVVLFSSSLILQSCQHTNVFSSTVITNFDFIENKFDH